MPSATPLSLPLVQLATLFNAPLSGGGGFSDLILLAAGSYLSDLCFWWYLEWPVSVTAHTLKHIKDNKHGQLININVLDYATILINCLACYHAITYNPPDQGADPHPVVLLCSGFFIHHATLMGYVSQAVRCHTNRQLPLPRVGIPINYVSLMTDAVHKYEHVTNGVK